MVKPVSNYPNLIRPSCERHCAIDVSAQMRKFESETYRHCLKRGGKLNVRESGGRPNSSSGHFHYPNLFWVDKSNSEELLGFISLFSSFCCALRIYQSRYYPRSRTRPGGAGISWNLREALGSRVLWYILPPARCCMLSVVLGSQSENRKPAPPQSTSLVYNGAAHLT